MAVCALVLRLLAIAALPAVRYACSPVDYEEESCRAPPYSSVAPDVGLCANFPASAAHVIKELEASEWYLKSDLPDLVGPCNIDVWNQSNLTGEEFNLKYGSSQPVVVRLEYNQETMKQLTRRSAILDRYGDHYVTLATANTHSYRKVEMLFGRYISDYVKPQSLHMRGNETLYLFGDNDRVAWSELFSAYKLPPYTLPGMTAELSFGIAGPGSGVPFHIHGPTFAETVYGRKRWFLYPPSVQPTFDPDMITLRWFLEVYPTLTAENKPYECTLYPGEVIFLPNMWWHATLNVDTTVFMSTFLSPV